MSSGAQRSARYLDPSSREVAEDLARRSGLSLNEWVSRLMAEGPEDATSQDYFTQSGGSYMEAPRAQTTPRYETLGHPADEVGRVAEAMERLSDRIETAESRQALAIAGVERSVREVIVRIDAAEREQMQVAARFESELADAKGEAVKLAERLRKIEDEAAGPRSAEALRALEGAIGKVAGHVYETERRANEALGDMQARVERLDAAEAATISAIRELKSTCAGLDERLAVAAEDREAVFVRLAENLSVRVEAVREELGRQLTAAADARFDRVEQALARMDEHVRTAEHRSAGALERMGREVLEVAQTLSRRVQTVERQSADTADRLGADISRIAGAVEERIVRSDSIQAAALEKLGGEIARITERLADRIANAERRSAQAIDDVGEQVARVTERIGQRHERSASELAERIRQSEERTARLLEEARQKLEERLAESHRRVAEAAPAAPAAIYDDADDALFADAPFPRFETPPPERPFVRPQALAAAFASPRAAPAPVAFEAEDFDAAAEFDAIDAEPAEAPAPLAAATSLEAEHVDLEPNVGFDMDEEEAEPPLAAEAPSPAELAPPAFEPDAAPEPVVAIEPDPEPDFAPSRFEAEEPAVEDPFAEALTTREVIERARAAARANAQAARRRPMPGKADEGLLSGLSFGRGRRKPGPSGALMVASLLAAISLGAGGYLFVEGQPSGKLPKRVEDGLAGGVAQASDPTAATTPLAAVALAPRPIDTSDSAGAYSTAVAKITADESGGLADLTKLADGGYAPAQFYLAELYQDGKAGLKKDPTASRHWLEKAAEGGDRTAMHNLALDLHEGVGGARNAAAAAEWFRRAAELGLLDSQFNLAAIYEHGDGVSQNPAEAYKWYLIAARSGDAEARAGALRMRAGLSADAQAVAERAAAEFEPQAPTASLAAASAPASPDLITAQRALSQLGYYQGPTDGSASPALHLAIAAYQRDQGLPVTGAPDPTTIGKLAVYTR